MHQSDNKPTADLWIIQKNEGDIEKNNACFLKTNIRLVEDEF